MLRVLEVVEMRVLEFDASLHLLIPVVDDLKMKLMLQLLIDVMELARQQQHAIH